MYKLLIADDEAPVIEGLKANLDWEKYGLNLCATALNGKDAYEQAVACCPDIVITDIRMPLMSGLELIEQLKARAPDTIFIVFSGYSDFAYARKSIELDVVYYLIKPSSLAEIEAALTKAVERRRGMEEMKRSNEDRGLLLRLDEARKLRNFMHGDGEEEAARLRFDAPYVVLAAGVSALDQDEGLRSARAGLERQSWCKDADLNKMSLIAVLPDDRVNDALGLIAGMASASVSAGCSEPIHSAGQLRQAHEQAMAAMKHAIYIGAPAATYAAYMAYGYLTPDLDRWHKTVAACARSIEGFKALISDFEQHAARTAPDSFIRQFISVARLIFQWADQEVGMSIDKLMGERFLFHKCMAEPVAVCRCIDWLNELVRFLEDHIHNKVEPFVDKTIDKLKKYMQEHLSEDISLVTLAAIAHMSPAYLSGLFKKKNGTSISDYLVFLRMEHAKRLLRNTNMKINDIARAAGYSDQRYFSAVFKRYAGSTAGEYRDSFAK